MLAPRVGRPSAHKCLLEIRQIEQVWLNESQIIYVR